ncbi:unknown [Prevotella sp. CAG:873]|nr:unknown [Prevotella sp. CAG:873]
MLLPDTSFLLATNYAIQAFKSRLSTLAVGRNSVEHFGIDKQRHEIRHSGHTSQ